MAYFTQLPEELHEKILELAIYDRLPAPSPAAVKASHTLTRRTVKHDERPPCFPATSLLLVSHNVNRLTKSILSRRKNAYELDLQLQNEQHLYLTWLSTPHLAQTVDGVHVSFRMSGDPTTDPSTSIFRHGDGGPSYITASLWELLKQFLCDGPLPPLPPTHPDYFRRQTETRIVLNNLDIEVLSDDPELDPDDNNKNRTSFWARVRLLSRSRQDTTSQIRMHPLWMAEMIASEIKHMNNMDYHSSSYGQLAYHCIGTITIRVSGEDSALERFDLSHVLSSKSRAPDQEGGLYTLSTFGSMEGNCRVLHFWHWKYRVLLHRREMGWPTPPFDEVTWPSLDDLRRWKSLSRDPSRTNPCSSYCYCAEMELENELAKRSRLS